MKICQLLNSDVWCVFRKRKDHPAEYVGRPGTAHERKSSVPGQKFYDLSEREQAFLRGTKFGFVFQSFNLISELTVSDNIRVQLLINSGTPDEKFLNKIVRMLGLKERLHHYPAELSGGEQQRAAMARAMIMKPQILFADDCEIIGLIRRNPIKSRVLLC